MKKVKSQGLGVHRYLPLQYDDFDDDDNDYAGFDYYDERW